MSGLAKAPGKKCTRTEEHPGVRVSPSFERHESLSVNFMVTSSELKPGIAEWDSQPLINILKETTVPG